MRCICQRVSQHISAKKKSPLHASLAHSSTFCVSYPCKLYMDSWLVLRDCLSKGTIHLCTLILAVFSTSPYTHLFDCCLFFLPNRSNAGLILKANLKSVSVQIQIKDMGSLLKGRNEKAIFSTLVRYVIKVSQGEFGGTEDHFMLF